jgi:hypothetical protein
VETFSEKKLGICTGIAAKNETLFDGICFNLTETEINAFPTISFLMKGENGETVTLEHTPTYYLRPQYFCDSGSVGLGIDKDPDFTIIGSEVMVEYHTIFDRENKRIGFATADCPQ